VGDEQLLEESLVDLPLHELRCPSVLHVALSGYGQGLLQYVVDLGEAEVCQVPRRRS